MVFPYELLILQYDVTFFSFNFGLKTILSDIRTVAPVCYLGPVRITFSMILPKGCIFLGGNKELDIVF